MGPQHPATATALDNLAGLLVEMGDYEGALPLCSRQVDIWRSLNPHHPATAAALQSLAVVYELKGEFEAALSAHREAYALQEQLYGARSSNISQGRRHRTCLPSS